MRERLKADPSMEVKKYLNIPGMAAAASRSFGNMARVNLAHALMLNKQGIIADSDSKILINSLYSIYKNGAGNIELNPDIEDLYFNVEQHMINDIGMDVAGKLHTGRSRNDLHASYTRMDVRDEMLKFYPRFFKLRKELLRLAEENKEVVMTGYTHLQAAQPITAGFYFTAIAEALERDFDRITAAYHTLNISPLGSAAFAGTGFPIDRQYTSDLLGFDEPIDNAMDSIASKDFLLEISAAFAILANNINRFVHDLYIWTTNEFAYIILDDSSSSVSSIMPQKKNPSTLEHCKSKCSHFLAAFVDVWTTLKGVPYGHSREVAHETTHLTYDMFSEMEAILELLTSTISKMTIRKGPLKDWADNNFCTATELADEMVRVEKISFRQAHQIVGSVVGDAVDQGLTATQITPEMLDKGAVEYAGRPFGWSQAQLSKALDSAYSVNAKLSYGASAPSEVERMIQKETAKLSSDMAVFDGLLQQQATADEVLENAVKSFIG